MGESKKGVRQLWTIVIILALLSPLGVILPGLLKSGGAWGEDNSRAFWRAPFQDYAVGEGNWCQYFFFTLIGAAAAAGIAFIFLKMIGRKR
ncbi:MAG: hypothetical protein ACM3OC_06285 [Deltaproteobacteria bacterium]